MKKIILILCLFLNILSMACSPAFYEYIIEEKEVYYGLGHYKEGWKKLEDVNAAKFTTVNYNYGKDDKNVYYENIKIQGVDPKTAVFLGGVGTLIGETGYMKDRKKAYFNGVPIEGSDSKTFEILGELSGYAKDKNNVYVLGEKLENRDAKSFEVIKYDYTKDKNGIYFQNKKLIDAKPEAYKIDGHYLISNAYVYNGDKKTNYDFNSFKVIEELYHSNSCTSDYYASIVKDKDGVYNNDKKVAGIDPESFRRIQEVLYEDKNYYYAGLERLNINKSKAEIYILEHSGLILKDDNNIYELHREIKDLKKTEKIDVKSFDMYAVLESLKIFKDRNYFYINNWYSFKKIEMMPVKNSLVFLSKDMIMLKSNNKIGIIDRFSIEYSDTKGVDVETYVFIKANKYLEDLAGMEGYGAFIDKNNIYEKNRFDKHFTTIKRKLTKEEYKKLKEYVFSQEELNEIRGNQLKENSKKNK